MKIYHPSNKDQKGIVSITVTVIFIMVISLTVLGFSQVTRRNSQEALDKQLSAQAFYAAEVGVNDARTKIKKLTEGVHEIPSQTNCKDPGKYTVGDGVVDAENGVSYTCTLVKNDLDDAHYSEVGGSSIVANLNASSGNLNNPTLSWRASSSMHDKKVSDCPKPHGSTGDPWTNFTSANNWTSKCPFGVMRIDLTPISTDIMRSVDTALANTMSISIYPASGNLDAPRNVSYKGADGSINKGLVVPASCSDTECKVVLNGLTFPTASMRVRSAYVGAASFTITAPTVESDIAGESAESEYTFDSQVEIDVTGKAQDVMRRIKVRVSITGGSSRTDSAGFSDYALHTNDSICKRFVASPILGRIDSCE